MYITTVLVVKVQKPTCKYKTTARVSKKRKNRYKISFNIFSYRRKILEARPEARIFLCVPECKKTTLVV